MLICTKSINPKRERHSYYDLFLLAKTSCLALFNPSPSFLCVLHSAASLVIRLTATTAHVAVRILRRALDEGVRCDGTSMPILLRKERSASLLFREKLAFVFWGSRDEGALPGYPNLLAKLHQSLAPSEVPSESLLALQTCPEPKDFLAEPAKLLFVAAVGRATAT